MSDVSVMNEVVSQREETKRRGETLSQEGCLLTLGIAPVRCSSERVRIGRLNPKEHAPIKELRREYRDTHVFRFDARNGVIANLGVRPGIEPMGEIEEVEVAEHLLLIAEAIQHQLRQWLSGNRKILRWFHPLVCLGHRDRLLTMALKEAGVERPDRRLDVVAKWSLEVRLMASADPDEPAFLGLIVDVGTSNVNRPGFSGDHFV